MKKTEDKSLVPKQTSWLCMLNKEQENQKVCLDFFQRIFQELLL